MRLSRIHHDQPVKLLDQAIFFIEFVLHHKQAKHLLVAAHDHNWFQYHSLDVIGFLLAYVASATLLVAKCCVFIFQKVGKTGKKKKRDQLKKKTSQVSEFGEVPNGIAIVFRSKGTCLLPILIPFSNNPLLSQSAVKLQNAI